MKELTKINKDLNNGQLPSLLNYSLANQCQPIDLSKVKYNAFYRSFEYAESKFDSKLINLIGEKAIIDVVEKLQNTSPLEEYLDIKNNNYNANLREDE